MVSFTFEIQVVHNKTLNKRKRFANLVCTFFNEIFEFTNFSESLSFKLNPNNIFVFINGIGGITKVNNHKLLKVVFIVNRLIVLFKNIKNNLKKINYISSI